MHDLDRTQLEFESELDEYETSGSSGCRCKGGACAGASSAEIFDEIEEMELAAELLEVNDEEELEQFLGKLIKKVGKKVKRFVKSPIGGALVKILKRAAVSAVPGVGAAIGAIGAVGDVVRAAKGGGEEPEPAAPAPTEGDASEIFGLELEGLSAEDAEFEVAKRFVRLGAEAASVATSAPSDTPPQAAAQTAVSQAASRHAPGLGRRSRPSYSPYRRAGTNQGRWERRGNRIILYGV